MNSSDRLQMSNTFYESAGQNWFTLDSVHIHYNWTHEATFNASDVYAPSTYSYHCQHVSSLQKYDTLLVPSSITDNSANWHITFTDFQVGMHCFYPEGDILWQEGREVLVEEHVLMALSEPL